MDAPQIHGFISINKPEGCTSRDVVNRVLYLLKKATGKRIKLGHCGTLDPLATGVLVVAVGHATRLVASVQEQPKSYVGRFILGQKTNTDDIFGTVISSRAVSEESVSRSAISDLLPSFTGRIDQVPPAFSAVKIDGRRAYKLAIKGAEVSIPARPVQIDSLTLTDFSLPEFELKIECGSGTYIRSLGRDIGARLGCGATMKSLVRTRVGVFGICEARDMDSLNRDTILQQIEPSQRAVPHLPRVALTLDEVQFMRNGRPFASGDKMEKYGLTAQDTADGIEVALETPDGEFVAIARIDEHLVRAVLVFPDLRGRP